MVAYNFEMKSRLMLAVFTACALVACKRLADQPSSTFIIVSADHTVSASSVYPDAVDPTRVGTYPIDTHSGAGYFYDDVLEYRVWFNPRKGAKPLNGNSDYFMAFAEYEAAKTASRSLPGAEEPIVLVRQLEWINEPEHGRFIPEKTERITEWQVQWLTSSKRREDSIQRFLEHPREEGP
jgi:putative acetyltransferase